MLNSIIKEFKQKKSLPNNSIFYINLHKYLFFEKKELNNNIFKFVKQEIDLNKLLIDNYFKKPYVVNIKEITNKTGIPDEVFYQVGNYMYKKNN
tara:strand:- start:349 stop:630 length:282 start_codon:yes stop_codon:yes gene_type:complete